MNQNDSSKKNNKSSNIVLKIGITYIIPIFLAICGVLIICTDVWKQVFNKLYFYDNSETISKIDDSLTTLQINNEKIHIPKAAESFASIKIDSINLTEDIYEGSYNEIMALGLGHYSFSGLPGFGRNCIIRGTKTDEFSQLNKVKNGDRVLVSTDYGEYYYEVTQTKVYEKDDDSFLDCYSKEEKLTLYTDYPFDNTLNTNQKYVVTCKFISCDY